MYVPGGKCAVKSILDVDNVETTDMLLTVNDNTSTAHVTATSDHNDVAGIELDEIGNLAGLKVELHSVVDLDEGVGVTDGAAIVGDNVWHALRANADLLHLQELVGSLFGGDAVNGEAALDVVEETEVLARLLDGDDIYIPISYLPQLLQFSVVRTHEASGERGVGPDLVVNLDQTLHGDRKDLLAVQGILQPVTEENNERERFPQLMGTGGWAGSL